MLAAEYRVRITNYLWGENSTPLSGKSEYEVAKKVTPRMINLTVPIVLLTGLSFFFMYKTGGGGTEKSFMETLADADSMLSKVYATFITLVAINVELLIVVASVLAGATMGDHCGPISDTTVMSSTFSGSDHIDYVKTQVLYALTCSAVAAICYTTAGAGFRRL